MCWSAWERNERVTHLCVIGEKEKRAQSHSLPAHTLVSFPRGPAHALISFLRGPAHTLISFHADHTLISFPHGPAPLFFPQLHTQMLSCFCCCVPFLFSVCYCSFGCVTCLFTFLFRCVCTRPSRARPTGP